LCKKVNPPYFFFHTLKALPVKAFRTISPKTLVCQQFQGNTIIYIHALDFFIAAEALLRADLSDFLHISKQVKKFCWNAKPSIFAPLKKFSL
jgi:hypothetical protein